MTTATPDKPRGVLRPERSAGEFAHERRAPPDDLAPFVEHFWTVAWARVHVPVVREVLSHPSVHVAFERGHSGVAGVPRGRFTRRLEGEGRVIAVKFRPGGFRPFVVFPVARITDRVLPVGEIFGAAGATLERAMLAAPTFDAGIALATAFLRARLPPRDPRADEAADVVARILHDRSIRAVDDVARQVGRSPRALQRLFSEYVGVSPKWVIRRYRLHDAIERMDEGTVVDWPSLAHELGYCDQAHFIRDFKRLVGRTPADYSPLGRVTPSPRRARG